MNVRNATRSNAAWSIVVFTACSTFAADAQPTSAQTTPATNVWRLHDPTLIETYLSESELDPCDVTPCDTAWCNGLPVAAVRRGWSDKADLELWRERRAVLTGPNTWVKTAHVKNIDHRPLLTSLGADVGVLYTQSDGSMGGLWFQRFSLDGQEAPRVNLAPLTQRSQNWEPKGVVRWGDALHVVSVREAQPGGRRTLVLSHSDDLGRTWREPRTICAADPFEVEMPRLVLFASGPQSVHLLLWKVEGEAKISIETVSTQSAGAAWTHTPTALEDPFGSLTARAPLFGLRVGGQWQLVYLAIRPTGPEQGRFCLTHSEDQGRTWRRGQPLTELQPVHEESLHAGFASIESTAAPSNSPSSSSPWVFCHTPTSDEGLPSGPAAWRFSFDHGRSWRDAPVEQFFNGLWRSPMVSLSPAGDRVLVFGQVSPYSIDDPRRRLVVQEYSTYPLRGRSRLSEAEQRQASHWLSSLSADEFDSRQTATRRLLELGPPVLSLLDDHLRRTADPEVRRRASLIRSQLVGPCFLPVPTDSRLLRAEYP